VTAGTLDPLTALWDTSAETYHTHTQTFPTHTKITNLLTAVLDEAPHAVLDFGCGPGNSTRQLRRAYPNARLVGLDTAPRMIDIALQQTPPQAHIRYLHTDVTEIAAGQPDAFDLIVCSNSLFHVADKPPVLTAFRDLLADDGQVVFSLYDTVLRPTTPVTWPLATHHPDTLMNHVLGALRDAGLPVAERAEDREILTDQTLAALFGAHGLTLHCAGMLRLRRSAAERLAFFTIPSVAAENFPHLEPAAVTAVIRDLTPPAGTPHQERTVYAFIARKTH
jgi:trans-aconitate methyltransferase